MAQQRADGDVGPRSCPLLGIPDPKETSSPQEKWFLALAPPWGQGAGAPENHTFFEKKFDLSPADNARLAGVLQDGHPPLFLPPTKFH